MSVPKLKAPVRIMVVDDDSTNRLVAVKLCELFGASTLTAAGGEEAVYLAATSDVDLVLMDVRMPRFSGLDAAKAIRSLPAPARHVPIIALTADVEAGTESACLAAGMNAFVAKPISAQKLFSAIDAALASLDEGLLEVKRTVGSA